MCVHGGGGGGSFTHSISYSLSYFTPFLSSSFSLPSAQSVLSLWTREEVAFEEEGPQSQPLRNVGREGGREGGRG